MSKCIHPGCDIEPVFNYPQFDGKGKYCKKHSLEGMIDVKNKKCGVDGCKIRPHFNFPGQRKGERCFKHAETGMINIITVKCREEGCGSIASYNFLGEKKRLYCSKHALDGMICVIGNKCAHEGCSNRARYGFSRRVMCRIHKEDGMHYMYYKTRSEKNKTERQDKFLPKKYAGKNDNTTTTSSGKDREYFRKKSNGTKIEEALRHRKSKLVNWEVVEQLLQ